MSVDLEDFEFAIVERFPDAFVGKGPLVVKTPRDVVDHLAAQAAPPGDSVLLLARAFYAVRRQLASQLDCPAKQITPRTRFADLLPDRERRVVQWQALKVAAGMPHFPPLVRPDVVARRIAAGVCIVALTATAAAAASLGLSALVPLIGIATLVLASWVALRSTSHLALEFSPDLMVGALARYVVAEGSPMLGVTYPRMSRSQITEVVRELFALEMDVPCTDLDATWDELVHAAARHGRRGDVAG